MLKVKTTKNVSDVYLYLEADPDNNTVSLMADSPAGKGWLILTIGAAGVSMASGLGKDIGVSLFANDGSIQVLPSDYIF